MGELARRRRARDLHLSRGQLAAGLVGVLLVAGASFAVGYRVGGGRSVAERPVPFATGAPREGLVELLARVDASGDVTGGIDALTFPDALTRSSGGGLSDLVPLPGGRLQVEVGRYTDVADARALREHLRAREVRAWVGAELQAGVMTWRVIAGGFTDQDAAEARLGEVREALSDWSGADASPRVIERP